MSDCEGIEGEKEIAATPIVAAEVNQSHVAGQPEPLTVREGFVQVFSNQGPVGNLALTVAVVDADGSIIAEDDATSFTVNLDEVINDNSATSAAITEPAVFKLGRATVIVNDDQAESVSVTAVSDPVLSPISGTATFGTISGSGLGIQVYRELKEKSDDNE